MHPVLGSVRSLTHRVLQDTTLQSPSIPTMAFTFPTLIMPMMISSMPPVQVVAQLQATGTMYPLTHRAMSDIIPQLPSIPTMLFTSLIMTRPIPISSIRPVQAVAQPRAIGTKYPSILQVRWGITPQSLLIPTMLCTSLTLIIPIMISSIPPAQVVAQPQAIGTLSTSTR